MTPSRDIGGDVLACPASIPRSEGVHPLSTTVGHPWHRDFRLHIAYTSFAIVRLELVVSSHSPTHTEWNGALSGRIYCE